MDRTAILDVTENGFKESIDDTCYPTNLADPTTIDPQVLPKMDRRAILDVTENGFKESIVDNCYPTNLGDSLALNLSSQMLWL